MGHQHKCQDAKKHPGAQLNQALSQPIVQASSNDILTCASAHRLAKAHDCLPKQIGIQADLLELRIAQCQLGLFGYAPGKKKINPDAGITPELKNRIFDAQSDGKIDCKTCWKIATEFKISRINMGSVCERLEIRIKPCQLGVF
ncbi:hypothetical protein DO021_09080 [Desulfobacter hydrogenophilus]|uniref:Uncharacterized protein n=1 Tax=Desulfobacter hydrogenophilus TaxID=2291 RepID=A0A328FH02_9BACT|nr:hypothetical protein [Desulfobacter hydrogenophilus]NDY73455.1 hypothetical protein [Desulfobacter hydrogenophilus]QBH14419.1 hypothetical protein EYB58_16710 [Desulfobacter hydrogenophilus]RAM02255.1 hypothetical protein DO021_09080 [Desulfobacter hydrogenophilus]